ncbi:LEAF RUST 10 DISEASE-RESISTANCE LOCUS RECEPTOR-LIKE PROTEIN KINASE-like 2.3 isoform X2 [Syzygium oleosum]|uniref:LEAF RUST 10 DISEASE-RESISTANCE LOCUS RECEPTOR-LIKE PROTEIN KINASE-like 2.3 isoform X2 n=1 Tax=Syzygium oleosum TaxID=219896 RepID=UPI0024B9CF07|nr:LEAF RUST 10 DISEASE-RESISTANCE LOCUS RECEPTOR-LIKE PROTEIN KINASE-like 2.3 isoform X2 [Syzygium oleosum]
MHKNQLLLLLLFLHRSFSIAIENNRCTTSCSKVANISYSFWLRGDPKSCGNHKYELACVNNRTVLDLYSSQYYVRHIDYTNFTIRIADVGLPKGNCSSLPLRSLSCPNFRYKPHCYECGPYTCISPKLSKTMAIVDCTKAVDSRFNIDASSCLDGIKFLDFSSTRRRVYAMVDANVSYVEISCTVELMAMIPGWVDGNNLRSYAQIHDLMVYGFELSRLPVACKIYGQHYYDCDINKKGQIHCRHEKGKIIDYLLIIGLAMGTISLYGIVPFMVVKFILGTPCVMMLLICKWRRRHLAMDRNIEEFLQSNNNFLPIRYSYSDIKKITSDLKDKLGEGGYGYVFKGRLRSGCDVTVKILKKRESKRARLH